jgi:predicted metal-dependent phosphoesterase TrpH
MPRLRFDLQSHSTHSDGVLEPAEVVRRAAAAGIEVLALSDHDTVDGVEEALGAADEAGIVLVPAVEISAVDPPYEDLHLLGYGVDHRDPALLETLEDYRADRLRRADRMGDALRELGWGMDEALLDVRRAAGKPVGRPHLADAVVADPANAARLADEGLETATDLLVAYLIPGTPAYRGRERPTVAEAIATIHAAGGLAVWAHPFWDIDDAGEVVAALDRFAGYGLDGVEAFYVTHSEEQVRLLHDHCAQRGLQTTGSSDFHGPDHPRFAEFGAHQAYDLVPTFRF